MDRELWIELGEALLERAPSELVERWRSLSAEALTWTAIEGASLERFAAWRPEQRDAIVLGRLRHHQHEFMFEQLIQPWLLWLGWALPPGVVGRVGEVLELTPADVRARQLERVAEFTIAVAEDERERACCLAALDGLIEQPGWPTRERVLWVIALLGRCEGEAALVAALTALATAS